ncbi:hypothetical protein QC589_01645 [Halomonas elongata]|uniref:hypothetical protein n=1 Tax=Halomonas elongata TaxID=2746 RepID=UPI003347D2E6
MSNLTDLKRLSMGFFALPLACAGLMIMANVQQTDRDVAAEQHRQYCEDVALWRSEVAQGVPLNRRAGQPDHRGIADEQCPGIPTSGNSQRQLASN